MADTVVVPGRACPELAGSLASALGAPVAPTEATDFPDGEILVRVEGDVAGKDALIVQSTPTNGDIVELLLLLDAAHEAGAATATAVVPYYGYARQDQVFRAGEGVSARAIARALYATANRLMVVDVHKRHVLDFFPGVAQGVTAVPTLSDELGRWGADAFLAPDAGARGRAQAAAERLDLPFDHLEKKRLSATEVTMKAKDLDVDGLTVAILDDMIASGGTMCTAAGQLKDQGAKAVFAACTHGVFTPGAVERLKDAGIDRVLCTDTLRAEQAETVSAGPAIAEVLLEGLPAPHA